VDYEEGEIAQVTMHDGTRLQLHKLENEWDPKDRLSAMNAIQRARAKEEIITGLLYVETRFGDLHDILETSDVPLNKLTAKELNPGAAALEEINNGFN
jgi:2-oxoglutarate ferredoxin oxidoreductase subunit beta